MWWICVLAATLAARPVDNALTETLADRLRARLEAAALRSASLVVRDRPL
jgi:hypothetical protein